MTNLHLNDNRSPVVRLTKVMEAETLEEYAGATNCTIDEVLRNSDSEVLHAALDRLDPEYKKVLVMHYFGELPVKNIALALNIPLGTVLWRLSVARRMLAKSLGPKLGKKPFAVLAAILLGVTTLFGAAVWGVVKAVNSTGPFASEGTLGSEETLGSLGSEGALGISADTLAPVDPIVPNPDPIVPKDSIPAEQISTTENNTKEEETMNLKSIAKTATAAVLSVGAMAAPLVASAEGTGWIYDSGAKTLTEDVSESPWVLTVTVGGTESTINVKTQGASTKLDLSTANIDPNCPPVTAIAASGFQGKTTLTDVVLPDTLKTLGKQAFSGCTSLTNVTPFLPDSVTSIGNQTFYGCPIHNPLRISNPSFTSIPSSSGAHQFNNTCQIPSVDFSGSGLTTVEGYSFSMCVSVTSVVLSASIASIGNYAFYCDNLRDVYFTSATYPGAIFGGNNALTGVSGFNSRVRYPIAAAADWAAHRTSAFKPWDDPSITDANRKIYTDTFGTDTTPVGVDTFCGKTRVLVPIKESFGTVNVSVEGSPRRIGTPDPDYGEHKDVGEAIVGSVSQYVVDGTDWYESTGYRLDAMDEGCQWTLGEFVGERSVSYTPAASGTFRLTWFWEIRGHRISVGDCNPALGTTSITPSDYEGGYYRPDTPVVLTATAQSGVRFERWYGDVPKGRERDNPLTLSADCPRTVVPYFAANWTRSGDGQMITDGDWALSVSGSADALTVTGVKTNGVVGVIDLCKPGIGGTITDIGGSAFKGNARIVEVRLPNTVRTIGAQAFYNCTGLTDVIPFLPKSVTSIGAQTFTFCPIRNPLRISNPSFTSIPSSSGAHQFNNTCQIPSVDFSRSGLTTVEEYSFSMCASVTSVVLSASITSIGNYAFYCDNLRDVYFTSTTYPGSIFGGNNALTGVSGFNSRVRYPIAAAADWAAHRTSAFKPWNDPSITDANRKIYTDTFGTDTKPVGIDTFCGKTRVLVPVRKSGLVLLIN